jgi:hypothetical protein
MPSQTVLWTAVPNGVEGAVARLVCVVSPRLTDPAVLTVASYPDWVNWAQRAAAMTFQVQFDNRPPVPATRVSPVPDQARWAALVSKNLIVRPFQFTDHGAREIRSYPVGNVVDFLKQKYLATAVSSPTTFPTVGSHLDGGIGQVGLLFNKKAEAGLRARLAAIRKELKAVPPAAPAPVSDFLQAKIFHEVDPATRRVAPATDRQDFHQLLSLLTQYPQLQRQLGLVFDLTVPVSSTAGASTVRVIPTWQSALPASTDVTPMTKVVVGSGRFSPAPKAGSDLDQDMLALAADGFRIVTVDADGAALKARHFADTLRRSARLRTADTPAQASLPALRSAGLAVARTGRAPQLVQRFREAADRESTLHGSGQVTLDADALLYGLRWAIFDVASGQWYSLCERRGSYEFVTNRALDLQMSDSGTVTTGVTQRADDTMPDYYLSEFLCRWHGESLVAPRPGKSLSTDPTQPPTQPPNDPRPDLPLRVRFAPQPGSLPPLRYGRRYRLRAYATYLGGAGPRFQAPDTGTDFSHATGEVTYGRLEPVPAPALAMRRPRLPGESLHHMVIRSDYDTPAAATVPTERHVLPPKASQLLAETHGLFDTPHGLDPNAYALIAARAEGSLANGGQPDPADHDQRYYDTDTLSFPVESGTAPVPWLVDPLARGAALAGLPGASGVTTVDFGYGEGRTWRNVRPFRIKVVEGTGSPSFDPLARVLTVSLGKADTATVTLSAQPGGDDLPLLEIWRWLQNDAGLSTADLATQRGYAVNGRNWLLTPAQPLVLVHAVRRPLVPPTFTAAVSDRGLGSTVSTLRADGLRISRKSTVSVDVRAQWTDPVDTLDDTGWQPRNMVTRTAELGAVPVAATDPTLGDGAMNLAVAHDLGDPRFHYVTYVATAKSRFTEHFTETAQSTVALSGSNWQVVDATGVAAGSEVVKHGSTSYVRDTDYEMDYIGGRIRRHDGGAIAPGGSVDVTYLPSVTRTSVPALVPVRASTRPAPPRPVCVVPTYAWSSATGATGVSSARRGGGLRVYLDRPWWSSGEGELLGVVVWQAPAGATDVDESFKPYVTGWGMDPLYRGAATPRLVPGIDDFPQATATRTAVLLAERNAVVSVAGHPVQPDPDRRLWYCDIELAPGQAHLPFVRLALARYQPNALPGAELSTVVLAEFTQLAPDRNASVVFGPGADEVQVRVGGNAYAVTPDGQTYGRVDMTVEWHAPGVPGDLGWTATGDPHLLSPQVLDGGQIQWTGSVKLPGPRGSQPFRLVVREYDVLAGGVRRLTYTDVLNV